QRGGVIAQKNRADALVGRGDQDRAERAFTDSKADRHPVTATAVGTGCHPQGGGTARVEASVGAETGIVDRTGDAVAALQLIAHAPCTLRGDVLLRRHAHLLPEQAMEMKPADASCPRERSQL